MCCIHLHIDIHMLLHIIIISWSSPRFCFLSLFSYIIRLKSIPSLVRWNALLSYGIVQEQKSPQSQGQEEGKKSKEAVTMLTSRAWDLLKASQGQKKKPLRLRKIISWIKNLIFFLDLERSFDQKYTGMFLSRYVLPKVHALKWALKSKTSFVFCAHLLRQDLKPCGLVYLLLNCFQTFMIGARFGMLDVYKSTHIWRSTVHIFLGIYIMSAGKGQVTEDAVCLCLLKLFGKGSQARYLFSLKRTVSPKQLN